MSDWIVRLIEQSGYLGVGFLMFLETVGQADRSTDRAEEQRHGNRHRIHQ